MKPKPEEYCYQEKFKIFFDNEVEEITLETYKRFFLFKSDYGYSKPDCGEDALWWQEEINGKFYYRKWRGEENDAKRQLADLLEQQFIKTDSNKLIPTRKIDKVVPWTKHQ